MFVYRIIASPVVRNVRYMRHETSLNKDVNFQLSYIIFSCISIDGVEFISFVRSRIICLCTYLHMNINRVHSALFCLFAGIFST